jgi:hypothetical protein
MLISTLLLKVTVDVKEVVMLFASCRADRVHT